MRGFLMRSALVLTLVFVATSQLHAEGKRLWQGTQFDVEPGEVRIARDQWGVPHIFAQTDEAAAFGLGYAQATDRLGEVMKNFRRAEGTMAEAFGKSFVTEDIISRLLGHRAKSEEHYDSIPAQLRAINEAFLSGIGAYMDEHPEDVPEWAVELEPWRPVSVGRYIIGGWQVGDIMGDLRAGGIAPTELAYRGSNEWVVAPERTADGHAIALVDPHLSWYDQFRFFECRVYGETIAFSGVAIVGAPLPSLGHSQFCSIAMTTGSGDTADIFMEKINPDDPTQYERDGQWLALERRIEKINILNEDGTMRTLDYPVDSTVHGPLIARKDGFGYAVATPYMESVGLFEQIYKMITAQNLEQMIDALAMLELMGQNVMVATVDGDIYYQRTGKVPIRAEGVDPSRPIPGHLSANDWQGNHPASELVQVTNPAAGYMQNCNIAPSAMMEDSPMRLADYRPYIFGTKETPPHQRAAGAVRLLAANDRMTIDDALELAMSTYVHGAEVWVELLRSAWAESDVSTSADDDRAQLYRQISEWDYHSRPDSTGAMAYKHWKAELPKEARGRERYGDGPTAEIPPAEAIAALGRAAERMKETYDSLQVRFGDVFRVGRKGSEETWPVGGGSRGGGLPETGMATLRAIGFSKRKNGAWVGGVGQTSTQVVVLSRPPRSWTIVPLGQSDHRDSPHWDDQARELFSKGLMKPSWFMDPEGLAAHLESNEVMSVRLN